MEEDTNISQHSATDSDATSTSNYKNNNFRIYLTNIEQKTPTQIYFNIKNHCIMHKVPLDIEYSINKFQSI